MKSPLNSPHRTLLILFTVACLLRPELQADSEKGPDSAKAGGFAEIKDGIHHVDGKPFLKTAAWWGANHWMTERTDEGLGTQMSLPPEEVGTERDFYGTSGFSTTYFTFMRADIKRAVEVLKECLVRAKKTNQKVVAHLWTDPSQELRKKYNWTYVNEEGETVPLVKGFHHDAAKHVEAMREQLTPLTEAIKNEPDVIGYQIGGETWASISYDEANIVRYREWLKKRHSLEELSVRYGRDKAFYASWDAVFPPIKNGAMDFKKRELPNGKTAITDWARFNKEIHVETWVALVNLLNELDGRGRPISYEFNHGPYQGSGYGLYNWDFAEICRRTKNFTVGPGQFSYSLEESLSTTLFTKSAGTGPHFMNEMGAGSGFVNWGERPAFMRRHIWWSLATGFDGFHIWTFYNMLGANSEFIGPRNFDPLLTENLPDVYFELRHNNRLINSLHGVLDASKGPDAEAGLLYLEDSNMSALLVFSYRADDLAWLRTVATRGMADRFAVLTENHVDHKELDRYKVLILPHTPRITAARAQILADYVRNGGTLILMAGTAGIDDLFEDSDVSPSGPLAAVAGIKAIPLSREQAAALPLAWSLPSGTFFMDVRHELKPETAKVLAESSGRILATENAAGKGRVIVLAGKPLVPDKDDASADFVAMLLARGGFGPAGQAQTEGKANPLLYCGFRNAPQGKLLIVIENGDRAHEFDMKLDPAAMGLDTEREYNVFECFSTEATKVSAKTGWKFRSRIEPIGTRVFLITTKPSLDDVLPEGQRVVLDWDDPTLLLADRSHVSKIQSWGLPKTYTPVHLYRAHRNGTREQIVDASIAKPGAPRDLGNGFLALDIDGYCNQPLSALLKDEPISDTPLFGAVTNTTSSKESLGVGTGRVETMGDVPVWMNGRFIEMNNRVAEGIPVRTKVKTLSFFHHSTINWMHESVIGYYRVNYEDGTSLRIPIAFLTTIANLSGKGGIPPSNTTVWQSATGKNQLHRFDWKNPHPEKPIRSIDIVRNEIAKIYVWAVTARQ